MAAWATGAWATGAWATGAWAGTAVCAWEHGAWVDGAWVSGAWACEDAPPPAPAVPVRRGGDDRIDRGHRGYGAKRATLKRNRDREFDEQLRDVYRALLGDPRTADEAEQIVASVAAPVPARGESEVAREAALLARAMAVRAQADAMDERALQAEIALRFLHQRLRDMQDDDDFEAIALLLPDLL